MSSASKHLQAGTIVTTSYSGRITRHKIVSRTEKWPCDSGVMFRVDPPVPKSGGGWIDSSWFVEDKQGE